MLSDQFDRYADTSLAAHMLEHVVLMTYVPLALVLGSPWTSLWRGLPLRLRRKLARRLLGLAPLGRPWPAFLLLTVDLAVWHVPTVYDATLRSSALHASEHASYLVFGTLFWLPVLGSPPLRPQLRGPAAAGYVLAGAVAGWILALLLTFAGSPLYPAYAALPHRAFGLSPLADQQLAGGIMLAIGGLPLTTAVIVLLYRWLDETTTATRRHTTRSTEMTTTDATRLPISKPVMHRSTQPPAVEPINPA